MNRLSEDPEKRRGQLIHGAKWLERMLVEDARHARLHCQTHFNYIGFNNVFPCVDCEEDL